MCKWMGVLWVVLIGVTSARSEELTQFRLQFRDLAGSPIERVAIGDEFELQVHIQDVRPQPLGIVSAYLDVDYPSDLITYVPDSLAFGNHFGTIPNGEAGVAGVVDEAGSFIHDILAILPMPEPVGIEEALIFSARFRAIQAGSAEFAANPADVLPLHSITLLGYDDAVAPDKVHYDVATITIVPEPTTLLIGGGSAMFIVVSARRRRLGRPPAVMGNSYVSISSENRPCGKEPS